MRADERVPHHGATRNGVATLSSGGAGRSRRNKAGLRDDDVDADVWARASERASEYDTDGDAAAPPSSESLLRRAFSRRRVRFALSTWPLFATSSGFSLKASPARTRAPSSATLLVGGSHLLPPSLFVVLSPSLCHSYFFAYSFSLSLRITFLFVRRVLLLLLEISARLSAQCLSALSAGRTRPAFRETISPPPGKSARVIRPAGKQPARKS